MNKVKQLKWEECGDGDDIVYQWEAKIGKLGLYYLIEEELGKYEVTLDYDVVGNKDGYPELELAKEAAQKHFADIINDCLDDDKTISKDELLSDQVIKDITTEYLSSMGENPYQVKRGGYYLWEDHIEHIKSAIKYTIN